MRATLRLTCLHLLFFAACLAAEEEYTHATRHHRNRSPGGKRSRGQGAEGPQTKGLLALHNHHSGDPHGQPSTSQASSTWDGSQFWLEEHHTRTLYFEPVAGLGNRLRALASALTVAREFGVGVKIVWQIEPNCESCGKLYAPFVAGWDDLFSEPKLRMAEHFPGSNLSIMEERNHLVLMKDGSGHRGSPPDNCTIHSLESYDDLARVLTSEWATVQGEEVVCAKGTSWLTRRGENDAAPFFKLLQPSPSVQHAVDNFKHSVNWESTQWICTHVRRTDLIIWDDKGYTSAADLIQVNRYAKPIQLVMEAASQDKKIRVFLASDDQSAEREVAEAFPEGVVLSYPKEEDAWTRGSVEGIQAALVDILLLSSCPVLVGTFYSSYSETAKLLGGGFYIQVGSELLAKSKVATFDEESSEKEK